MLPYRVSIAGISELDTYAGNGVSHVISFLDPDWPKPESLGRIGHRAWYEFRVHDVIHERDDIVAPSVDHVRTLLEIGESMHDDGAEHLLVHCHMGMSRSTAAALILKAQFNPGREREAVRALLDVRSPAWPNSRMLRIADGLLQRDGALIDAGRDLYTEIARDYPHVAEMISQTERASEVPDAR